MEYRKATTKDINAIAGLVTALIGTCNLDFGSSIQENNIKEIAQTVDNYYVCVFDGKIVGACGISDKKERDNYNLGLRNIRENLYFVVDKEYQGQGIGTRLLELCTAHNENDIIYEGWGDNGRYINSKFVLERCGFQFLKDLGKDYYKKHDYCPKCINKDRDCKECMAEIWIKYKAK